MAKSMGPFEALGRVFGLIGKTVEVLDNIADATNTNVVNLGKVSTHATEAMVEDSAYKAQKKAIRRAKKLAQLNAKVEADTASESTKEVA